MGDADTVRVSDPRQSVVLIVDDEEMITDSLSSLLRMETHHEIVTFQSPREALKILSQEPVDLVISDFLMPGMDGLSFLSQVKDMYPETPRVLLTAYADKENAIKAINEVGLFQYLEKPWDNEQLLLVISNALAQKSLKETLRSKIRDLDRVLLQKEEVVLREGILKKELLLAQQVQQQILPSSLPQTDQIALFARYWPALEIGGDYYDVLSLDENRLGVLIADVTGHGISAALSTVLLKFAFSSFLGCSIGPGEILAGMNSLLLKGLPKDVLVAAMVAVIEEGGVRFRIANGGIPHPYLLRRKKREVERIAANGFLLGIFDEEEFRSTQEERVVELEEGDCLFLYTDGLSEAENQAAEQFGSGPLGRAILENGGRPGNEILENLVLASQKFSGYEQKQDDLTVLAIEIKQRGDR